MKVHGSLLLFTTKPHQEDCTDIQTFIWRLYVSYRPLNSITPSFEYYTPRCSDIIEDFENFCGSLSMISLENCSGYYQVKVRQCDQENIF